MERQSDQQIEQYVGIRSTRQFSVHIHVSPVLMRIHCFTTKSAVNLGLGQLQFYMRYPS